MALTSNHHVDHYVDQELRTVPLAEAVHVFRGALVGLAPSGYARPLVAGDAFAGIAYEEMDNTAGADGERSARLYTVGDFGMSLSGAAAADIGRPVFASADDTLTFVGAGHSYAGTVQDVPGAGQVILRIDPAGRAVKTVVHAVENLSAGADIAARAVHAFAADGWIEGARVVNQASAAAGIDNSNTCVIALAHAGGTVATKTYNATATFPGANAADSLGAIANGRVAVGDVLTLAVTNGTTADPGPFLVEVDYV